jgi:hypothetical protein
MVCRKTSTEASSSFIGTTTLSMGDRIAGPAAPRLESEAMAEE